MPDREYNQLIANEWPILMARAKAMALKTLKSFGRVAPPFDTV
jgi:hypothetical protein